MGRRFNNIHAPTGHGRSGVQGDLFGGLSGLQ